MSGSGGNFDRAFDVLLASDVGKGHVIVAMAGEECGEILPHWSDGIFSGEKG